jgi:hypothetical protein
MGVYFIIMHKFLTVLQRYFSEKWRVYRELPCIRVNTAYKELK